MKALLRYTLLFFFFTSASMPYLIQAQQTISGTVLFEGGEEAEGVIVRALGTDSNMIDYTLTDKTGSWSLSMNIRDSVLLEFSMFGYENQYKMLPNIRSIDEDISITLKPKSFDLASVTVKDRAIGVSRVGDTLTFNLTTFTTGAERTLGDVLKRLPGLEIREGSVYYGGEKITKMLVQGRDIINANQQLATEGIRADQLKEIKIIENYKESSQQFQSERSEDVAMDVRLKDNELNKWSGELEALGGYPGSGKGDLNAFNLNDKIGISGFARVNNVGDRVLTFRDMMNMMSDQGGRVFHVVGGELFNLMPSELNISDRVQANLDAVVNINTDIDVTERMKIKGFVIGAFAQRTSNVFMQTEYISENEFRTEELNSESTTPIGMTMWKMEWNVDSTTFMEAGLPYSFNNTTLEELRNGNFSGDPFNTTQKEDEWNYNFGPFAKMRKKVGNDLWNTDIRWSNSRQAADVRFEDIFPFLGIPLDPTDSLYQIRQDQDLRSDNFNAATNYKMILGNWFIQPMAEYARQFQSMEYDANKQGAEKFTSTDQLLQHTAVGKLSLGYETDDWEIAPAIDLNYLNRDFLIAGTAEEVFAGYSMRIVRKFNRAHRIHFNTSYGLQFPGLDNVKSTYEISSATQVNTGGYPISIATKGYSASVRYHNFVPAKRTFIFANISYGYNEDVISNYSERLGSYILSGYVRAPFTQNFNSRFFMGYELPFLPIRVEPRVSFNWSDGFATTIDQQFEVINYGQSYSLNLESKWDFPINLELGVEYNQNLQRSERSGDVIFSSWQPQIELEYNIGGFTLDTDFSYETAGARGINASLYVWDLRADYELKNSPIILKLEADNILNLDPRERVRTSFGLNVSEVVRYNVFPGYIVGGISWKF